MDYVYSLIGAFAGTWIVYNIFCIILYYLVDKRLIPLTAFIGTTILILIVTNYTMGFAKGFVLYMPPLFLWLILELRGSDKRKANKDTKAPLN